MSLMVPFLKHIKIYLKLFQKVLIMVIISAAIVCSFRFFFLGQILPSHSRLGFYSSNMPTSISVAHIHEQQAAERIGLNRNQIDWHQYYVNNIKYYFPKNMPHYTRQYIIKKYVH